MQVRIEVLVVFNLYFLFCLTALLATTLLIFLISTRMLCFVMLCFVESKTKHVSVLFLGDFMSVCWTKKTKFFGLDLSWTKTKSIRLDFHVLKPSPMNSISRPMWTACPTQLPKIESSRLELLETKLVSNIA